jgi:uncharacterized membrane protein
LGVLAERVANFLGTPTYIFAQTIVIIVWVIWNLSGWKNFDHYPFEFLVLVVSLQAAYAAPLILLAQTRQDVREDRREAAEIAHREKLDEDLAERTDQIHHLLTDVHQVTMELDEFIEEVHDNIVRQDSWRKFEEED